VDRTIFTQVHSPHAAIIVGGWPSLPGWIRRSCLEGVVDVILDELTVLERMLDGDLVVRSWRVQESLKVVLGRRGLGRVALGA
jgi:hypothetical protein